MVFTRPATPNSRAESPKDNSPGQSESASDALGKRPMIPKPCKGGTVNQQRKDCAEHAVETSIEKGEKAALRFEKGLTAPRVLSPGRWAGI